MNAMLLGVFFLVAFPSATKLNEDTTVKQALPTEIHKGAVEREETYRPSGDKTKASGYYLGKEKVGRRVFYNNGQIADEQIFKNGKLHGIWRQFYQDGQLFAVRPYRNGKPDGTFKFWDSNGKLLGTSKLTNGNGVLRQYQNYELMSENAHIPFVNGKVDGNKIVWGRFDGKTIGKSITQYKNGAMEGWGVSYRGNGSIRYSCYISDNKLHGVFRKFDNNGNLVEGYPEYYIKRKSPAPFVGRLTVTKDQYLRAAKHDKILQISLEHDRPPEKSK